ncbi:hypothetical protein [uncultured Fibrella sp.]|uniref:hypothetical protein n=1 Tax=uncultured Fibrella sp. TaxID=1284596 RepID=UPI0035CC53AB
MKKRMYLLGIFLLACISVRTAHAQEKHRSKKIWQTDKGVLYKEDLEYIQKMLNKHIDKIDSQGNKRLTPDAYDYFMKVLEEISKQSLDNEENRYEIINDNVRLTKDALETQIDLFDPVPMGIEKPEKEKEREKEKKARLARLDIENQIRKELELERLERERDKTYISESSLIKRMSTLFSTIIDLEVRSSLPGIEVTIEKIDNFSSKTTFVQPLESGKEYVFHFNRKGETPIIRHFFIKKYPKRQRLFQNIKP